MTGLTTSDPLIHIEGLRKAYGTTLVLDRIDLVVRAGEAVGLLGPNGAGKTTLLKILATIARPTRGAARVAGYDCARESERVRGAVGVVAHGAHVYDDLTALENLTFWTRFASMDTGTDKLLAALSELDLEECADIRVRTFSAGMKRRLSLARLWLQQPRVLLLDEPFSGLDQRARKWLEQYLQAFATGGGAILMATHAFGRELEVAGRLVILANGRIVLDAPRGTLRGDEIHRLYALHTEDAS